MLNDFLKDEEETRGDKVLQLDAKDIMNRAGEQLWGLREVENKEAST